MESNLCYYKVKYIVRFVNLCNFWIYVLVMWFFDINFVDVNKNKKVNIFFV